MSTVPVARLVPGLCAGCINMKRCCIIDETGESRYRDSRAGDTWTGSQTERQTDREVNALPGARVCRRRGSGRDVMPIVYISFPFVAVF